jgi:peptidoglycan/LPS O-acetylase OafA/YrhL
LQYNFSVNPKLGWRPALDGLRGFAVVAVMLRHFQYERITHHSVQFLPGGGTGVDIFLVLSGFLITTLLLQEWTTQGFISLRNFYIRRALRLFPAVAAFLAGFLVIASFVPTPTAFTGEVSSSVLKTNLAGILTYSFNWMMATDLDRVWGLGHLWSLSVEEQFYLFWPALVGILLRLRLSPWLVLALSIALFASSAAMPLIWSDKGFFRFYFATDYRMHSLMVGCILAQLYAAGALKPSIVRRPLFKAGLVTSLVFLVMVMTGLKNKDPFMYAGGYTFVALSAGFVLTAALYATRGAGHWLLTNRVAVYVGRRSYALYLWHYAIGFWLRDLDMVPALVTAFAASLIAAELSHRLAESPALRLKRHFGSESSPPARTSTVEVRQSAA